MHDEIKRMISELEAIEKANYATIEEKQKENVEVHKILLELRTIQ